MFRQSIVDIFDCTTTPFYLGDEDPAQHPGLFGGPQTYNDLHRKLLEHESTKYEDFTGGREGGVATTLRVAYRPSRHMKQPEKYWSRDLSSSHFDAYPALAWDNQLPIEIRLKLRARYEPIDQDTVRIRLQPRVMVGPTGWSTWISALVDNDHDLATLARVVVHLCRGRAFRLLTDGGEDSQVTLSEMLRTISAGVRSDVFSVGVEGEFTEPEIMVAATVLSNKGLPLARRGLSEAERNDIRKIVRPVGPSATVPFDEMVLNLRAPQGEPQAHNYMISDKWGRFIWSSYLLKPVDRRNRHLRCYHNNVVRSLMQSWGRIGFLKMLLRRPGPLTARSVDLINAMRNRFTQPADYYNNISLSRFYRDMNVESLLKSVEARLPPKI